MSTKDKASNTAEDVKGKIKETVGSAVGNKDLESKGKLDQVKSEFKDAGEDLKDAAGHVKDAIKGA